MKDYLRHIHALVEDKGYARVVDIAASLGVRPPSVTRMIQRLAEDGFVDYERYRGVMLSSKGREVGERMCHCQESLAVFLRLLGVDDDEVVAKDAEGIKHHVSPTTLDALLSVIAFFGAHEECLEELRVFQAERRANGETDC